MCPYLILGRGRVRWRAFILSLLDTSLQEGTDSERLERSWCHHRRFKGLRFFFYLVATGGSRKEDSLSRASGSHRKVRVRRLPKGEVASRKGGLLPLWSPFDISREDSWELIFPEFHLHILLEKEGEPKSFSSLADFQNLGEHIGGSSLQTS